MKSRVPLTVITFLLWALGTSSDVRGQWTGLSLSPRPLQETEGAEGAQEQGQTLEERVEALERTLQDQQEEIEKLTSQKNWLVPYWKEGLRFKDPDGNFELQIGGRIQADASFFSQNRSLKASVGNAQDGFEIRRARLFVSGTIHKNIEFKAQYDFAGGDADFKDVYIGMKSIPHVGRFRVGHMKTPQGLESLMSSRFLTFLERGTTQTFMAERDTGAAFITPLFDDALVLSYGVFKDSDGFADANGDGDYNGVVRVAGSPWYEDEGVRLLHVGLSYQYRNPENDEVEYEYGPAHDGPDYIDTGTFLADDTQNWGFEGALVLGPFSLQGEYLYNKVNFDRRQPGRSPQFYGGYIYGSYFITGESRTYKRANAVFDRIRPKQNFMDDGGLGAFEVALRYDKLDVDNEGIRAGELENWTAALNWYLNPNTRVMTNYVHTDTEGGGQSDIFLMRFQIDF